MVGVIFFLPRWPWPIFARRDQHLISDVASPGVNARDGVRLGVLGPVAGWDASGAALDLKGPRHRAVLARLAVARGRVVPLSVLIEDLWEAPPAGAAGAIQTFVS